MTWVESQKAKKRVENIWVKLGTSQKKTEMMANQK
jgi:hypothetical protein